MVVERGDIQGGRRGEVTPPHHHLRSIASPVVEVASNAHTPVAPSAAATDTHTHIHDTCFYQFHN